MLNTNPAYLGGGLAKIVEKFMVNPTPMQVEAAHDYLLYHAPNDLTQIERDQNEIKENLAALSKTHEAHKTVLAETRTIHQFNKAMVAINDAKLKELATKIGNNENRFRCML